MVDIRAKVLEAGTGNKDENVGAVLGPTEFQSARLVALGHGLEVRCQSQDCRSILRRPVIRGFREIFRSRLLGSRKLGHVDIPNDSSAELVDYQSTDDNVPGKRPYSCSIGLRPASLL